MPAGNLARVYLKWLIKQGKKTVFEIVKKLLYLEDFLKINKRHR